MVDLIRIGLALYLLYAGFFGVTDYFLLRWVVFLGGFYLLYVLWKREHINNGIKKFFFAFIIIMVVLFNPILPVYLYDKGTWILIDIITGILLLIKPIIINSSMDKNSEEYKYHFSKKDENGFPLSSSDSSKFDYDPQLGKNYYTPDFDQIRKDAIFMADIPGIIEEQKIEIKGEQNSKKEERPKSENDAHNWSEKINNQNYTNYFPTVKNEDIDISDDDLSDKS